MKYPHSNLCVLTLAAILVLGIPAIGQIGPDEHAKHHPQPSTANPAWVEPGGEMGPVWCRRGVGPRRHGRAWAR